jgi:4-hydroxy-2-oxoheptanedioate aldolase
MILLRTGEDFRRTSLTVEPTCSSPRHLSRARRSTWTGAVLTSAPDIQDRGLIRTNELKRKLTSGQTVVGSFLYVPSPMLTEIIGLLGFDFVVIDMEHGPIGTNIAEDMVRAPELTDTTPLLPVTHNSPHLILRALDIGAQGVHAPEESRPLRKHGRRQVASRARSAVVDFEATARRIHADCEPRDDGHRSHRQRAGRQESRRLLTVGGIDVYYLGPEDISNSLGIPGQSKDSPVVELVEDGIRNIVARGGIAGCIVADTATAKYYIQLGARYIASHAIRFMAYGSKQFLAEVCS